MKGKTNSDFGDGDAVEYELQKTRIRKIIEDTIYKLKLLSYLPTIVENDGTILRQYLNKTEADFVVHVCQESSPLSRQIIENRSDLEIICNMLEKINLEKKESGTSRKRGYGPADHFDIHVSYVVDVIFRCKPLLQHMETLDCTPDELMVEFIDSIKQLESIINDRLSISAEEEIKRDNDLKTAFRLSMMLSNNIQEMEALLEKQREELGKEHDRKEMILQDLATKIEALKEKCTNDINRLVYDSEVAMMKDYNKSIELQEEYSQEADNSTYDYQTLLEEHLQQEKGLRIKRLKVEAQLASWVAKYDNDIGEKQAEYDELEKSYNQEKEELDLLQDQFDEQEKEYNILMKEKEEEEERINYEKAWLFLQNRAARRIQKGWRAYKERKLAKKKRKGKKKDDSAGSKKGKGKSGAQKGKPGKDDQQRLSLTAGPDPNALLEGKFGDSIIGEIKSKEAFSKSDIKVDLLKQDTE